MHLTSRQLWTALTATALLGPACGESSPSTADGADTEAQTAGTSDDTSADTEGGAATEGDPTEDASAAWTIFVYGHADHNLSPSLVADMVEMSNADLGDHVEVIVMADWDGSQDGFETGTEWYRIVGGGNDPELIEALPESDLDDPSVLTASVARAFSEYPADHYGLIMWNHGGAWEAGFGGDSSDGAGHGPGLSAPALAASIGDALAEVGMQRLDFLSFDTCLMAGVEVLADLAPLSDLYIANAEIDYGAGWDYENALTWLASHPDAELAEFAAAESEIWDAHHAAMGAEDALLRSHASIQTAGVPAFVDAYAAFSDALVSSPQSAGASVGRASYFSLPGYFADSIDSLAQTPNLRDAGQFLASMTESEDPILAEAAGGALAALDAAVLHTVNGDLRAPFDQAGVHIELPAASQVEFRVDLYAQRAETWVAQTGWLDGLLRLTELADAEAPVVQTDLETEPGALLFFSEDADVAAADIQLAVADPDDPDVIYVLGLIGSGAIDPGFEYGFEWEGNLLQLGAGDSAQPVPVFPFARVGKTEGDSLPILAIPGVLTADGEAYEAVLPFDAEDTEVSAIIVFADAGQVATIPLADAQGMLFIPTIPTVDLVTGQVDIAEGIPLEIPASGSFPLADTPAASGQYLMITTVFDVWGNFEPVLDMVELQ